MTSPNSHVAVIIGWYMHFPTAGFESIGKCLWNALETIGSIPNSGLLKISHLHAFSRSLVCRTLGVVPENRISSKENSLQTINDQVQAVSFRGG